MLQDYKYQLEQYKKMYKNLELDNLQLNKDYAYLVKKFNLLEKEKQSLIKENDKLREIVYGRKDKS